MFAISTCFVAGCAREPIRVYAPEAREHPRRKKQTSKIKQLLSMAEGGSKEKEAVALVVKGSIFERIRRCCRVFIENPNN